MSIIDDRGQRVVEPGEFLLSVGGKQPGSKGRADAQTTDVVSARFLVTGKVTELAEK
jgi:beta-glucosidase